MAFLAEDGTGLAASNGYIDDTFADTYHTDRGQTAWLFSDAAGTIPITVAQKQAAIIRATDHIDKRFGPRFLGQKSTDAQALQWPRVGAYSRENYALLLVPVDLQKACAEYALRALLYGVLTPDPAPLGPRQSLEQGEELSDQGTVAGEIILSREKVGPLETEQRGTKHTSGELPSHPGADLLINCLIRSKSNRIIRG